MYVDVVYQSYRKLCIKCKFVHCSTVFHFHTYIYTALTSTEAPEVQPDTLPPTQLMEQDHSTSDLDPNSSSEATAPAQQPSSPPATTRGAPITPTRPTLLVSLPLATAAMPHAQQGGEGEDRFPKSVQERTPDGGRREFVGHPYRYTPINNGETVVTPERLMIPPNTVFGCEFPLNAYRRQLSDNNAHYHSLSRRRESSESEVPIQRTVLRQNSAPPYYYHGTEAWRDNNGRII